MARTIYIIRHGQSEGTRHDRADFGPEGGALLAAGIAEAELLKPELAKLGIDVTNEPVAVSELKRAYQTAYYAGFTHITSNKLLNEVNSGLEPDALDSLIEQKKVPEAAKLAAQAILDEPPTENVWVTHGMVIAGLAHELGIPSSKLYIPRMGSLTRVELS